MKRYSYPLIMLLCLPQFNTVNSENLNPMRAMGVGGVLVLVTGLLSYKMGESSEKSNKEAELKHKRLEREAKENAEQERQRKFAQRFHHIERMQQTSRTFIDRFRGQAPPERWDDEQQRNFAQEVLATSGSITAFEKQLNTHIKSYETFDPEMAQTHKDLYSIIGYLKRAMHTNPHIATQKKHEEEEAFKQAQKKAYLKKAECEAQFAKDQVATIAQIKQMAVTIESDACGSSKQLVAYVKEMVSKMESTARYNLEKLVSQVNTLESSFKCHSIELNGWQSRRVSEHQEQIEQLKKLQQTIGNLQKKTNKTQKDIASVKEEIKQERSNQEAKPSAPPTDAVPSYPPPSTYDPRYAAPSTNPPATNPNYRP